MISVLFLSAQSYTIRQNTMSKLVIEFTTPKLQSSVVKAGDARYTSLTMDGNDNSTKVGFPSLPELTKLIEIPLCDEIHVNIVSADYEEYDAAALNVLYPVMPCLVEVAYTSTTGTTTTAISNSEFMNALVLLDERCGNPSRGTRSIEGNLEMPTQNFTLQQLLDSAFKNRSDLRVAEESVSLAEQEEKLAIRERIPDVELVLGANYNTRVRNEEAPAPPFMGYSVGLTIPLPVLSVNAGVRKASMLRQQQAKLQSQSIRNSIQGEVVRAYNVYQASLQKVKVYNDVLMVNAQEVLDGKLYAYQRGETSLLEVLTAQHTFNEIQKDYATCVYDCMVALIELERSIGL